MLVEKDQGTAQGDAVVDSTAQGTPTTPETGTVTDDSQTSAVEAELSAMKQRLEKDNTNASRKITEMGQSNSTLQQELVSRDAQTQQLQQQNQLLQQQLAQSQQGQRQDDYVDAGYGGSQGGGATDTGDPIARQAIREMYDQQQQFQSQLLQQQTAVTQKQEIMKQFAIPEADAEVVMQAFQNNDPVGGAAYAQKAAERERLRAEAQRNKQPPPPMTGGEGSGGTGASAGTPASTEVDDIVAGKFTATQLADRFANEPGLLDRMLKRKRKGS